MASAPRAVRTYDRGAITRVKLHNFLTYADVEFVPGPRLNVIMGPNGTGKSSIVCAIAIGLGASPKVLGRADTLTEFVKTGAEEAFVEIDLRWASSEESGGGRSTLTVRRDISKSSRGHSKWKINGASANEKEVKKLVEDDLKIQIANLCTFLPQEKVGEFSAFDDVGLLKETEKALGGQHLLTQHEELVAAERVLHEDSRREAGVQEAVENLEDQKRQLEPDKKRLEAREAHLRKVALCETRIMWIQFEDKKQLAGDARDAVKDAKVALTTALEKLEPLRETARDAAEQTAKVAAAFKSRAARQFKVIDELAKAKNRYETAKGKVEEKRDALNNQGKRREKLAKKVESAKKLATQQERQLQGYVDAEPDCDTIDAVIQKRKQKQSELRPKVENAQTREAKSSEFLRSRRAALKEPHDALKRATHIVKHLEDAKSRQLQALCKTIRGDQCRVMRQWLDEHDGRFRMKVYGPTCLEVSARTDQHRAVVEAQVGAWVWYSFVCQCKADYDAVVEHAQQAGLEGVNVLMASTNQSSSEGVVHRVYSNEIMANELRPRGIVGYLDELIEAPGPVLAALNDHAGLSSTLFGDAAAEGPLERKELDGILLSSQGGGPGGRAATSYVVYVVKQRHQSQGGDKRRGGPRQSSSQHEPLFELYRYQGVKSRYARGDVTQVVSVARGKGVLGAPCDPAELAKAKRDVADAERRTVEATDALNEAQTSHAAAKQALDDVTREHAAVADAAHKLASARKTLSASQKRVAECERQLATEDAQEAHTRRRLARELAAVVGGVAEAFQTAAGLQRKVHDATVAAAAPHIAKDISKHRKLRADAALAERERETAGLEKAVEDKDRLYQKLRAEALAKKRECETAAPLRPREKYETELDELPELEEEVEQIKNIEQAEADRIHDNPNLMDRYNKLVADLEKEKAKLDAINDDTQKKRERLDLLRAPWEKTLRDALEALKHKFAEYMASLNARGDVAISEAATFDKWGLVIRVAFRDGAALSKLEAHVQSGGERSVSTIMFLMALQAHMPSPFRVVDEINQGMDEVNERIVFKRVVQNSTGPDAPQYFLITPKLLENLDGMNHPDVRACIVFNGPFNFKRDQKFDVDHIIKKKRRLLASSSHNNNNNRDDDDEE